MATASALLLKRQLNNLIKRFKFEELEDAVIPTFPELSWTRIRSKLIKNHQNFTVFNAVRVIEETIDKVNLREKDLRDRLATLEIIDISRHDKKKIWYGYELKNPNKPVKHLGKRDIQNSIEEELDSCSLNMDVKVVTYNDITFVCLKEKGKKRNVRQSIPIFFALFLEHKYFFCSKKFIPHDFIKVMTTSLGYKSSKKLKLMGRDLKSLIRLLWIKQQGVLHVTDINQPPVYKPSGPMIKDIGVDYTQAKQRKNYADKCFGKDPPTLELLVIEGPEERIHHNLASLLPTDNIRMNWEFRSHNIINFLTSLAEKRVFMPSLPHYASNLMMIGKNELTLQTG